MPFLEDLNHPFISLMYVVVKEDKTLPVKVLRKVKSSKLLLGIYCCDRGVLIVILEAELSILMILSFISGGNFSGKVFKKR